MRQARTGDFTYSKNFVPNIGRNQLLQQKAVVEQFARSEFVTHHSGSCESRDQWSKSPRVLEILVKAASGFSLHCPLSSPDMSDKKQQLGVGILGAAAIARKNVKAIGKTTNGIGRHGKFTCLASRLNEIAWFSGTYLACLNLIRE